MKDILAKTFSIQFQKIQIPHLRHTIRVKLYIYIFFILYTFGSFQRLSIMVYTLKIYKISVRLEARM